MGHNYTACNNSYYNSAYYKCSLKKTANKRQSDINENQFEFQIEYDIITFRFQHVKGLYSFSVYDENNNKAKIKGLEWYAESELDDKNTVRLNLLLKEALQKADGTKVGEGNNAVAFSADDYADKQLDFKESFFKYYYNKETRQKYFPKDFEWRFSVAQKANYDSVTRDIKGETYTESVLVGWYASEIRINKARSDVRVGHPVILIRDMETDDIAIWGILLQ